MQLLLTLSTHTQWQLTVSYVGFSYTCTIININININIIPDAGDFTICLDQVLTHQFLMVPSVRYVIKLNFIEIFSKFLSNLFLNKLKVTSLTTCSSNEFHMSTICSLK